MKWLEKIIFYFSGRYGNDELSKFLSLSGLIVIVLAMFMSNQLVSLIGVGLAAYGFLRIVSKEKENRRKELSIYIKIKTKIVNFFNGIKNLFTKKNKSKSKSREMSRGKAVVSCPNCSQKLRVPKGKTLTITCSNCQHKFTKKT